MYSFKIDPLTNDLLFDGQGNIKLIEGADEVGQQINRQLTTRMGEWFLNAGVGLDWDVVFAKPYIRGSVEQELRRAIMEVDGVSEVPSLELDFVGTTRELSVRFEVTLDDGQSTEGVIELG